jgi:hypothetical protein
VRVSPKFFCKLLDNTSIHSIYDPFDTLRIPDARIGFRWRIHQFKQTISSFPSQSFLFLPCYLLVKFNLEDKAWFCKLSVQIVFHLCTSLRVSWLHNFLLTGTLPYTGFTFEVPKHQSYLYIYICATVQYLQSNTVLRVCKLYTRSTVAYLDCVISYYQAFALHRIHFRFARTTVLLYQWPRCTSEGPICRARPYCHAPRHYRYSFSRVAIA